jgi:hypothetical protein
VSLNANVVPDGIDTDELEARIVSDPDNHFEIVTLYFAAPRALQRNWYPLF